MHLFEQHRVKDYDEAARLIPVIDYGPHYAGVPGALERVAGKVAHACENVGFFYALNHGVSGELIDRAFAASRRFHALPLAQKLALRLDDNNIGYLPMGASVQGAFPSCTGAENPPRYPSAVFRDLVLEFYRANSFHQKGHHSAAAAQAAE
jgi:isopenicillin N synthase-like dioxygenase